MIFSCTSPCKINLFLYITGKRPDGFHNLQTLFALLKYGDTMVFEETSSSTCTIAGSFSCPVEKNIIFKAFELLKKQAPGHFKNKGIHIKVDKKIPEGSGLGGGSSNAATTLLVLNRLFKLNFSNDKLADLAVQLGADVPVFVKGKSAFAQGRGEDLTDVVLEPKGVLVVTPKVCVNTKAAFADPDLKRDSPKRCLEDLLKMPFLNDFTPTVRKSHPLVGLTLDGLLKYGSAQMSGSGSSCFVLFNDEAQAKKACAELILEDYQAVFATAIASRSPVFDALDEL